MKRRSFLLAIIAVALALLPLSLYGLVGAKDDGSMNSGSAQASAAERMTQFTLAPAADAIANCFSNAAAKVTILQTADEVGTDTFTLSAKGPWPDTTFVVFLTELPVFNTSPTLLPTRKAKAQQRSTRLSKRRSPAR